MGKAKPREVEWHKVDEPFAGLTTNLEHEIRVLREAIPLILVPGIMGSRLRRSGTNGEGDGADGRPNMRWNPDSNGFMWWQYSGAGPAARKAMLVGSGAFDPDFLEVHDAKPVGNGFQGVHDGSYGTTLRELQNRDWGPLAKIFDFPVYAFGYNWTDSCDRSGAALATRIDAIIKEAKDVVGSCEKVILITHSMGGLVSRSASELHGARSNILGIVHGVQPTTGSPAGYWRMKAGFEGMGPTSRTLGNSGPNVTAILANMPGGLELLPHKKYRTNAGNKQWLTVTEDGRTTLSLPRSNPYEEIYRVRAVARESRGNAYWGLVDPDLLEPGAQKQAESGADPNDPNSISDAATTDPWKRYLDLLDGVEKFTDSLGVRAHPDTYPFHGVGHDTADIIELRVESNLLRSDSYPKRGFRGFFKNAKGQSRQAVLQDPGDDGDGTVSTSSGSVLDAGAVKPPEPLAIYAEHQPAYDQGGRPFLFRAIGALCSKRYRERRG